MPLPRRYSTSPTNSSRVVGRSEARITGWNGSAVRALAETAADISARLGFVEHRVPLNQESQDARELRTATG
jgi:hypothetical protein